MKKHIKISFLTLLFFCELSFAIQANSQFSSIGTAIGLTGFGVTAAYAYTDYCNQQEMAQLPITKKGFISYFGTLLKNAHRLNNSSPFDGKPFYRNKKQIRRLLLASELLLAGALGNFVYQKQHKQPITTPSIPKKPDYNRNLYDVVAFGDASEVKRIFDAFAVGSEIKITPYEDYRGDLMAFAIVHDNVSVVQALMERKYPRKQNYLKLAIQLQKYQSIAYLIEQAQPQEYLNEAMVAAALWSDTELLEKLETRSAQLDYEFTTDLKGNVTPFAATVISGHYLMVDWLYKKITHDFSEAQKKAFLERRYTSENKTALEIAIAHGHQSVVRWLGKQGATFNNNSLQQATATGASYIINEVKRYIKN
jgi:hypothetical protein